MARVDLALTTLDDAGVTLAQVAGTVDGWSFTNYGKEFLVLKNTGAGAHTVTVQTPETVDDLTVQERTISLPAGSTKVVGPFFPGTYNQSANNKVFVDIDATPAEVSAQAFRFPS